jgi:hypothetical protein
MLEVSHDAAAAEEKQLFSSVAEQSKYCSIYTAALNLWGD